MASKSPFFKEILNFTENSPVERAFFGLPKGLEQP
jgi:hypothetical protein